MNKEKLGSGVEGRIKAQFRAKKRRLNPKYSGMPALYLQLARQWKRPVQEIKRIVGTQHGCANCEASVKAEKCPRRKCPISECPEYSAIGYAISLGEDTGFDED